MTYLMTYAVWGIIHCFSSINSETNEERHSVFVGTYQMRRASKLN
jgi:hypothetical protein